MKLSTNFLSRLIIFTLFCIFNSRSDPVNEKIIVTNDSPTLIGTPIKFTVQLTESISRPFFYRIYFKDDQNIINTSIDSQGSASTQFTYNDKFDPNHIYKMVVSVELRMPPFALWPIGSPVTSDFILTDDIGGLIEYIQPDLPVTAFNRSYVATGSNVNFTIKVHDPSEALTNLTYQWLIGDSRFDNYTSTWFTHRFDTIGNYSISTIVNGQVKHNNASHQGTITQNVTALEPIQTLVKEGATSIVRDHNLKLSFTIQGGTAPFWFCNAILPSNKSILPCENPIMTDNRTFSLEKYFRENGTFFLKMRSGNDVSVLEPKEILIEVQEFTRQPQISVVIIPVVCSILALTVVVFGVAYHINNRHNYTIETADFDFQKHNIDELIEKTFFERMWETLLQSLKSLFLCGYIRVRWSRLHVSSLEEECESTTSDQIDEIEEPMENLASIGTSNESKAPSKDDQDSGVHSDSVDKVHLCK